MRAALEGKSDNVRHVLFPALARVCPMLTLTVRTRQRSLNTPAMQMPVIAALVLQKPG